MKVSTLHRTWLRFCFLFWVSLLRGAVFGGSVGGLPIEYVVDLPAPQTQMIEMSMRVPEVAGEALVVSLPVWRPGRYVVLDPAGTVQEVRAVGENGRALSIIKTDKSTWRIENPVSGQMVMIRWRVYANSIGDRTRHVDDTHAFISPSSVFFYVPERRDDPVVVRVNAPEGWRVATGLEHLPEDEFTFVAANYDVLVDSPLEIGVHERLEFLVDGVPHEIVIWGEVDYDGEQLKEDFAKIVAEQAEIFGDMPYERYVFLLHVGAGRGGTEHLNSTIMQTSRKSLEDAKAYKGFLGLVAHEFFHTWNVKQLRPAGIQPYDYQRENYSRLFWMAEGTTSYYDGLTLVRTGLMTEKKYLEGLGRAIDGLRNHPGRTVQSLEESSFDAWIKFNKPSPHSVNSTVNFYSKGALVSMLLDMELRRRTGNEVSLDDLMKAMYERYPLSGPGYTTGDLVGMAEEMTGSDYDRFFAAYVRGTMGLDYENALEWVGLEVKFKPRSKKEEDDDEENDESTGKEGEIDAGDGAKIPQKAYLGIDLTGRGGKTVVRRVRTDGPAYDAGVMVDDEIVAMNGRRLGAGELEERLRKFEPQEGVELTVMRRDHLRVIKVILASRADGKWVVERMEEATEGQRLAYESWVGQVWEEEESTSQPASAPETP